MNRRNFLKGFLAVTGTSAVAPAFALNPVPVEEIKCGMGLMHYVNEQIARSEIVKYDSTIDGELFLKWTKEIFSGNNGERTVIPLPYYE